MLANRVNALSESLTMAISAKAKKLKLSGENVISFSAGEPDFDTPKVIKDELKSALDLGCGKYTAVAGTNEVLNAICNKLKRDNNLDYEPSQIITTVGAKHSLFNIFQCMINPGDEVIIPSPYWVSYPEMVKFAGGVPIFLQTSEETNFKITPDQLKNAINSRTKLIVLNSPSNPSGMIYTKDELMQIAKILENTNIMVVSDEIYEKLSYSKPFTALASISDDMFQRTITINGLSKCGAMPGWRFGYLASTNNELISAIKKLQSQSTSNISSIVQAAAIPALLGKADRDIEYMRENFIRRCDFATEAINNINGLSVLKPDGAFYLFVNCKKVEKNSMKFSQELLEKQKVAVVAGIGFGMEGYFRLSFATDMQSLQIGISRIADFVKNR